MTQYTIKDLEGIIPTELPHSQVELIEKFLNTGVIPPEDPCLSCEPSIVRKYISVIQSAQKSGLFPPKREAPTVVVVDEAEGVAEDIIKEVESKPKPAARKASRK